MANDVTGDVSVSRGPRLWPAGVILGIQLLTLVLQVTPGINNAVRFGYMMGGPALCVLLFLVWLLFFSRVGWGERLACLGAALLGAGASALLIDASMGVAMWIYGAPLSMAAVVLGLWLGRAQAMKRRFAGVAVLLVLVWSAFPLLRLEGFDGEYWPELRWRWSPTAEAGMMAAGEGAGPAKQAGKQGWTPGPAQWPMFRGAAQDSRVTGSGAASGVGTQAPPVLWRVPTGPAWSSFAYVGAMLYTQEQVGEQESITCRNATTGELVWRNGFACRFSNVVAGAGPRATPTYVDGKLYTFGAKAILACQDAGTGEILWQHDLMAEVKASLPVWGFSSSPLVMAGKVMIYAGGEGDNGVMAFDAATGTVAWRYRSGGMNFSSLQRVTLAGQELALFGEGGGLVAFDPATGTVAWTYKPERWKGPAIVQPQQIGPESLIVPLGDGIGVARLEVKREGEAWKVSERWSSRKLRPSFNDFVVHESACYGFDNHLFVCIDVETGEQRWKHKGYGFGQVLLLADVNRLVVTTEQGEVAFVAAEPGAFREVGRYPVLKGKTWNHPVAAEGRLFVRNGEETVALGLN